MTDRLGGLVDPEIPSDSPRESLTVHRGFKRGTPPTARIIPLDLFNLFRCYNGGRAES